MQTPLYNFERFTHKGSKSFRPCVTIRKGGYINFSTHLVRHHGLDHGHWFAVLFYDSIACIMGIMFTQNPLEDGAIKVCIYSSAKSSTIYATIRATRFFKHYNLPCKHSSTVIPEWSEKHQMLLIKCSEACRL